MANSPPLDMDWQKLIAAILENLPALLAIIAAIIEAITTDGRPIPAPTKLAIAHMYAVTHQLG